MYEHLYTIPLTHGWYLALSTGGAACGRSADRKMDVCRQWQEKACNSKRMKARQPYYVEDCTLPSALPFPGLQGQLGLGGSLATAQPAFAMQHSHSL